MYSRFPGANRAKYLNALLPALPFDRTDVVESTEKLGSWVTARECWERGAQSDGTHIVILNEDVTPVSDFDAHVTRAISRYPDQVISYYTKHAKCPSVDEACWHTSLNGLTVAFSMPIETVREFLAWQAKRFRAPRPQHTPKAPGVYPSDAMVDLFLMATDRLVYTTIPALVEHAAPGDSILGNNNHPGRVARVTGEPPLDWARPPIALGPVFAGTHWHLLSHVHPPESARAYAIERRIRAGTW